MKKIATKRPKNQNTEVISLLKDIKEELIIERKSKLKNALILATAIVMFAVPLNFTVEVAANYLDSSSTGDLEFFDYYSVYYWFFFFCIMFVITGFWSFFRPMSRIFMDSFDWNSAFKDLEEEHRKDEYFVEAGMGYECPGCLEFFESYRSMEIHEEDCRSKNPEKWKKWDEEAEEEE